MAGSGGVPLFRYGRDEVEWDELEDAGLAYLIERARLERVTSYTERNAVLSQRTGFRLFDFDQDSERAAMGELLGRISDRELPGTGVLIWVAHVGQAVGLCNVSNSPL
jgi:hypothetical protein